MIWEELGIEPTNDLKKIKKAYAKKLKLNRPDQKPEEFQALYSAYQAALQHAQFHAEETSLDTEQQLAQNIESAPILEGTFADSNTVELLDENYSSSNTQLSPSPQESDPEIIEFDEILARVRTLLDDESRKEDIANWHFLSETSLILDNEYNWQIGKEVFSLISERTSAFSSFNESILKYLDSVFSWSEYEYYLRDELGDKKCNELLSALSDILQKETASDAIQGLRGAKSVKEISPKNEAPLATYYFGHLWFRAIALLIDLSLIAFPTVFIMDKLMIDKSASYEDMRLYIILILFFIFTWIFDCSKYQATPGKMLFKFKVTNKDNQRLPYWHGFLRTLVFCVSSLGSYFVALINAYLGGNFIHDRLTKSHVLDIRRSEKEDRRQRHAR